MWYWTNNRNRVTRVLRLDIWNTPLSDIGKMSEYKRYILADIMAMFQIGWILVQYFTNMAVLLENLSSEISLIITRRFARRPPWCKYINALSGGLRHLIRPVVGDLATDRRQTDLVYSAAAENGRHKHSAARVQSQFAPGCCRGPKAEGRLAGELWLNSAGAAFMSPVLGGGTVYSELRLSVTRFPTPCE